jgi:uncharacterized protein involved in exopolysaccharide biosynthesis
MKPPLSFGPLTRSAAIGFIAAVLVAVLSLFLPDFYRSEAQILPVETRTMGALGQYSAAAAVLGINLPGSDSGDANYVEILKSRWLMENLINMRFEFHQKNWRFGRPIMHAQTLGEYLNKSNIDRTTRALRGMFTVTRDLKTRLLVIGVETKSPDLSQQIVQKTTEMLENFLLNKAQTRGGNKAVFAYARLQDARVEMNEVENALRDFLSVNRAYQTSSDPEVRLKGMHLEAELKLRQQIVATLTLNHEQALLEEKNDVPILNVLDQANLPCDKSRPARSLIVLSAFLLATVGSWTWLNRQWVMSKWREGGSPRDS